MENENGFFEIYMPVSKSIGARFLVATYFAGTLPADPYFEDNDDLRVLQQALLSLYSDEQPIDYGNTPIDVNASGTALRFVSAVCASTPGADFVITGTPRLCRRPMLPLINVLRKAGASIETLGPDSTGPYRIQGKKISGGVFSIEGNISSQFISALMLVAPSWEKGLHLDFTSTPVSFPYIEMTAELMKKFGINVHLDKNYVEVLPGTYIEPEKNLIEADWSSASFFYEANALGAPEMLLHELLAPEDSSQGDADCCEIFQQLGVASQFSSQGALIAKTGYTTEYIELDFKNIPDLLLPFSVGCLLLGVKFHFTGVANLRLKESDRIAVLIKESEKLGFKVSSDSDTLFWNGEKTEAKTEILIDPHDDHRVAMAFSMAVFKLGEIKISHPEVVDKSFAEFWLQLSALPVDISRQENSMTIKLINQ